MRDTYSLYEAKAKFSAIVRQVREGRRVIVTLHGKPVAEIRPIPPGEGDQAARLDDLAERGILVRPKDDSGVMRPVAKRAGALKRFLAEREE